jgi:Zn-dependent alcohol dehydrogenase
VVMYDAWVIPAALQFLQRTRGTYPFDRTVSHRYALEDINRAFSEAEWNREGAETATTRAVVTP